jgi:CHAT domain-containing protein
MRVTDTIGKPYIAGSLRFAVWNSDAEIELDDLRVFALPLQSYILEDGSVDRDLLLYEGERLLAQGIGSARSGDLGVAFESLDELDALVAEYENNEIFTSNIVPTELQWIQFDAMVGRGITMVEAAEQGTRRVRALALARNPAFIEDAATMQQLMDLPADVLPILEAAYDDPDNALGMLGQASDQLTLITDDQVTNLNHAVHVIRAMHFMQINDFDNAAIAVAHANRFKTNFQLSHYYYAIILEQQGNYRQALDLWRNFYYPLRDKYGLAGEDTPVPIILTWRDQVLETLITFYNELEPAETILQDALVLFEEGVFPRDPQRVAVIQRYLGDAFREGYRLHIDEPVREDYVGTWLHEAKPIIVVRAENAYRNSADAYDEIGADSPFSLVKFWESEVQWDIAHWYTYENEGLFFDQDNSYWYRTAIETAGEAYDAVEHGWIEENINKYAFMFAWELEMGFATDPGIDIDAILNDIIPTENGFYAGAANTRLAWRTGDSTFAINSTPYLLAQAENLQTAIDNWAYSWDEELYLHANHHLGVTYYLLDQPELAEPRLRAAREVFQRDEGLARRWVADLDVVDINDWLLADSLVELGQYRNAIDIYHEIALAEEPFYYPNVMLGLARAYEGLAQFWEVLPILANRIEYYENHIVELETQPGADPDLLLDYRTQIIESKLMMVTPYIMLGQTEQAIVIMNEALDEARAIGDTELLVDVYISLANSYLSLSDTTQAAEYLLSASELAQDATLWRQRGEALLGLGRIYMANNSLDDADVRLGAAKWAMEAAFFPEGQIRVYVALGDLALLGDESDYLTAERQYNAALSLAEQEDNLQLQAAVLVAIARLQFEQGNTLESIQTSHDALSLAEYINDREMLISIHSWLGHVLKSDNRYDVSSYHYAEAIDFIETARRGFASESLRSQFATNYAWVYADYADLQYDLQNYGDFFIVTERARARAFLDQLAVGPLATRQDETENEASDNELLLRMTEVLDQLDAVRPRLVAAENGSSDPGALRRMIRDLESEYSNLVTRLQATNPQLSSLVAVDVASIADIQATLDVDTTLLSYYITEEHLYALIITSNQFVVHRIDGPPLTNIATDIKDKIAGFQLNRDDFQTINDLYEILITPVRSSLNTSNLIIVPHSVLHYLPFGVLTADNTTFLSDEFAISYLPSISTLLLLPTVPDTIGDVLAFGNPDVAGFQRLRYAEQEVENIVAIAGGSYYTGSEATEEQIWLESADAGVLHLAVHGTFNQNNTMFSALHLTPSDDYDGRLETHEIYELNLSRHTELVVLSACDTGVGTLTEGDEFTGLNRAFLYAGAPSVLATLWSVDDEATAFLMEEFFKARAEGHSNAEALQLAQIATRRSTDGDWRAFILTGQP